MKFKRIFLIVIDSVGAGYDDKAHLYGDVGSNTLKHLSYSKEDFSIPTLTKLGIGSITDVNNAKCKDPIGVYGKIEEESVGKDTLTGHWEMMGIKSDKPFPSFTDTGFPKELIDQLEKKSGYKVLGNIAASGTEIIKDLGEQAMKEKAIIVYTSADSVLQIAAHIDIISLKELYRTCEIARRITIENDEWKVGRIIARPFIGPNKDSFVRTADRHDYVLDPPSNTVLDALKGSKFDVIAVGKIKDIFNGAGITNAYKTKSNAEGMDITIKHLKENFTGLVFTNLVDFDSKYGHRRDPIGYAKALEEFDIQLKTLIKGLKDDDLVIVTADHGNDPTFKGTDHTREYVPLLVYANNIVPQNLNTLFSFGSIGATIAENFGVEAPPIGSSFLCKIKQK
ncbi:MAG TPA: phosphopentomutase [Acholeplasma sp.]|nr:phosphopentomutase [Acholeplasma sp.]